MKRGTPDHPKMKRLARVLGCHPLTAVGLMEVLWHWTAKYAPAGDIGKHSDDDIADGVGFCPDMSRHVQTPSALVAALVECGWFERCDTHRLVVHDWAEHADEAVKKWADRNHISLLSRALQRVATCLDSVETCRDKNSLPLPLPEPEPEPEPERESARPLPECLRTERFAAAWRAFIDHLTHKQGQRPSDQWIEKNLGDCMRKGEAKAVADLEFSVGKNANNILDSSSVYAPGNGRPQQESILERAQRIARKSA